VVSHYMVVCCERTKTNTAQRDYLRRSQQAGFLIPLSGGIDSCATATLVYSMCRIVYAALLDGNSQVKEDVSRIAGWGETSWQPKSAKELCNRILHAVYMGVSFQDWYLRCTNF